MFIRNNSRKIIDVLSTTFYILLSMLLLYLCALQAILFGFWTTVGSFLIFFTLLFLILSTDTFTRRYKIQINQIWHFLCILIYAVFIAYISSCMTHSLPSDTQILYDSVAAIIKHRTLDISYDYSLFYPDLGFNTLADYYCRYPNNIAMLLVLTAIYSVGSLFGFTAGTASGQILAVFVTALFVTIGIHFLCKSAQCIFDGNNIYLHCLLINVLFLSYYYSSPNFYTDIWILCPISCGFYYSIKFYSTNKKRYLLLCSIIWAFGSQLKITAAIPLIAFFIFIILDKKQSFKEKLLSLTWLFIPFILFIFVFQTWYHNCNLFDFSRYEDLYFPFTVWVSYGSHGLGGYFYEDSVLAYHTPYYLRKQVMANHVKDILSSYTPFEYLKFLNNKLSFVWGDGLFEGGTYSEWALFENWTNFFTNSECWGKGAAQLWANSFSLMLSICGLIVSVSQIKKRDNNWLLFINVIFLGVFLYLCIFEAAPRRAIPAIMFLMLDTLYILKKLCNYISQKHIMHH